MAATIHELSIQSKHTLCILHKILVILVKFVLKNHDAGDKDLEKVLSDIIKQNLVEFQNTGLYRQENYRKYFADPDPCNPDAFVIKDKIPIDTLDVSSLCLLLITVKTETKTRAFIFKRTQDVSRCCKHCKHKETASCEYEQCKSCKKECKMIHIKKFCKMVKCFRDCFAHDSTTVYESLASGKGGLKEFPLNNWEELWEFIWNTTNDCMNAIKGVEEDQGVDEVKKLISEETFKDFEMEMRLGKNSENVHLLLPKVVNQIDHYYKVILDAAELQDLDKDLKSIKKGNFKRYFIL